MSWISIKKTINNFLDTLFPNICICCEEVLNSQENQICINCISELPYVLESGIVLRRLEARMSLKFKFQKIFVLCNYNSDAMIRQIIHHIKYKDNKELAYQMGLLTGYKFKKKLNEANIDLIIPIPLHPKRQRKRGYNQAHEIAKGLSDAINCQLDVDSCTRVRNNKSQTKLSGEKRQGNVENLFEFNKEFILTGKHILIVDDVITTGATIASMVASIPQNANIKISILSLGATN